jgi:putative hemolysin
MIVTLGITVVVLLICLGAFFAGSETGIYRLSRFNLRLGAEQKRPFYILLTDLIKDGQGLVLSVLIGNNLANYLATSTVTYLLLSKAANAHTAELYATVIMTPLLFVFVDIIPKSVYYYRADSLMPRFAPLLWLFNKIFTWSGIVKFLKMISGILNRILGLSPNSSAAISATGRHHIRQIIQETRDEGIVSSIQLDIMHRLVNAGGMPVREIMIGFSRVKKLNLKTDRTALLANLKRYAFSRLPVYKDAPTNIVGYINTYEALGQGRKFSSLDSFLKPLEQVSSTATVVEAINIMRRKNHRMLLVVQGPAHSRKDKAKLLGIVTIKDLVGVLTGELGHW